MSTELLRRATPLGGIAVTTDETTIAWGADNAAFISTESRHVASLLFRIDVTGAALTSLKFYGKVSKDDSVWVPVATDATAYTAKLNPYIMICEVRTTADGSYVDRGAYVTAASKFAVIALRNPGFAQIKVTATSDGAAVVAAYVVGYNTPLDIYQSPSTIESPELTVTTTDTHLKDTTDTAIDPAIKSLQTAGNASLATIAGKDFATQTTLAAILAKIVAAPALEGGNLATIAGKDFATQTTLAALNAKVTAVNTGTLALEAGGNLASIATDIGAVADDTEVIAGTVTDARMAVELRKTATASTGAGTVTVGNTTSEALASNANRIAAVLTNDSDTVMYLGLGTAAVIGRGIRLNANGGAFEITAWNMFTGAINVICNGTGKTLCVTEY